MTGNTDFGSWMILSSPITEEGKGIMTRLFVYGTLRKGCGNHRRLDKSKYVGIRKTAPGFSLLCLNGLPIMVRSAGDSRVTGEMYEVTPTTMKRLDILEGHPDFLSLIHI